MRRIPLPPECFYHSSEAVCHINSKLQDPEEQCSDETINAIATLVMFEVRLDLTYNFAFTFLVTLDFGAEDKW